MQVSATFGEAEIFDAVTHLPDSSPCPQRARQLILGQICQPIFDMFAQFLGRGSRVGIRGRSVVGLAAAIASSR
jgi:hypothetical protein